MAPLLAPQKPNMLRNHMVLSPAPQALPGTKPDLKRWPPPHRLAKVLAPLGADTRGSQFLDPNGRFPNHIPNPEDKDAMAAAVDMVKRSGG